MTDCNLIGSLFYPGIICCNSCHKEIELDDNEGQHIYDPFFNEYSLNLCCSFTVEFTETEWFIIAYLKKWQEILDLFELKKVTETEGVSRSE